MATKTITSKKWQIQARDIVRGFLIASLTSALVVVQQSLDAGHLLVNWKPVVMAAIGGGVSYILKNWLIEPTKEITYEK